MNVHQPMASNDRVASDRVPALDALPPEETGVPAKRKRRFPWVFFIVLIVVGGGAFYAYTNGMIPGMAPPAAAPAEPVVAAPPPPPRPTALSVIDVTTIAPQTLTESIRITGSLSPAREAILAAQASGTVLTVNGQPGEAVAKDAVLLEIDPADLNARLEERQSALTAAQRSLELAQGTLANTRTLQARNVATQSALDQAEGAVVNAEAAVSSNRAGLRAAETALANATLKAPFAGVIAERAVDPGSTIAAGTRAFTIVDISSLTVEAAVPSSAIGRIGIGQAATVVVDGAGTDPVAATVDRINPVAMTGTRSIPVYLTVQNPDGRFRGGMFASGSITLRTKEGAIAVPSSAIREDTAGAFVLAIANGALVRAPIVKGEAWNEGRIVEVTGLSAGQQVVTAALPALQAGTAVVVEK